MSYILTDEHIRAIMSALYVRGVQLASVDTKQAQQEKQAIDAAFSELVYQQKH